MDRREATVTGLGSALLGKLEGYWQAKRDGAALPARRDIDPIEIGPALLPHLALLDVEAGSGRLRYRLVGTRLVAHYGRDATGRYLDELDDLLQARRSLAELCHAVAEQRRAKRLSGWLRDPKGAILDFECLALPLSSDGLAVDMIFCGLDTAPAPR